MGFQLDLVESVLPRLCRQAFYSLGSGEKQLKSLQLTGYACSPKLRSSNQPFDHISLCSHFYGFRLLSYIYASHPHLYKCWQSIN